MIAAMDVSTSSLDARAAAIAAGDRRALARAITLVESTRPDHRAEAEGLIERVLPSAGDELQGIKKGIVELAELLLVNKADGELKPKAQTAVADYRAALRLLRPLSPLWQPEVLAVSAVTGEGLDLAWSTIERHRAAFEATGEKTRRRAAQAQAALWTDLGDGMIEALRRRPGIAQRIPEIEAAVASGTMTSMAGARRLLGLFLGE